MSGSFPAWLDPATLAWAADYCHAMAVRLADTRGPDVGADVCARGLREARTQAEARSPRLPPATRFTLLDNSQSGSGDG
jgi:hypothetical protein